jgi:hypothetical protein
MIKTIWSTRRGEKRTNIRPGSFSGNGMMMVVVVILVGGVVTIVAVMVAGAERVAQGVV